MQIELIAPASEDSTFLPRMGLGVLAALTEPTDEVIYTDDIVKPFDLDKDVKNVDLVGISVDSKTARRSYEIATAYRRRGVKVVFGGIHPTAVPDEAALFADAVVVGEAEETWPTLLKDFKAGEMKPLYGGGERPVLGGRAFARRDIFRSKKYIPFQVVQTMRGCPFTCEFCSVSTANGTTMRFRPVDDVIAELRQLGPRILFADDNVMVQREYSAELFTRMVELGKTWVGQCSLAAVRHVKNVELMAKSGCKALFIGFESVDEETLKLMGKRQNRVSEYLDIIRSLSAHGIATWGSFVFGFDTDTTDVFERTAQFVINAQLTIASYAILTPYPGTKLYHRLQTEGRLTDPRWWLRKNHDADSPYFIPAKMTREQLHEGWQSAWKMTYSGSAIWKRWSFRSGLSLLQSLGYLPLNAMQNRLVKKKILGGQQRFLSNNVVTAHAAFERELRERIALLDNS
jgi:radical SAM superfamily enzyme YgiQ (UPF0313 family)